SLDSAALAAARVIAEGNIAGYAGSVEARATAAAQNAARVNLSENAVVSDPQVLNSLVASMVVQTEEKQSGIKKWKEVSVALNRLPAGTLLFSIIPGGMKSFLVSAAAKAKVRTANVHIILDTSASTYCPPQNVDQLDECGCGEASASGAPCSEPTKLTLMKDAVEEFIKQFDSERDRIGLVSFNTAAKVDVTMAQAARGWASSGIMTKLRSLQPAGQTNICDALYHAQVDMQQNGLAANAVYVLVSDGAPTAGRFSFANARQPLPGGPDYFIWDDRVDCIMSPDEPPVLPGEGGATVPNPDYRRIKKTMVSRIHDTAKPPNAPGKFHPGTFYELAMDRSGPTESRSRNGEMADYLESSWYEYLFSSFVPCSNISCREIIELEEGGASYAVVNRLRACLKDVSFNTYQNWSKVLMVDLIST
ncbi:MAG TPA: vWA domain-containing protein, partial [Oligoflexia bacterium]|nr:vWA domain-containing protein [Oligoflexia bacterium]